MVVTHDPLTNTRAKGQGERSLGSKVRIDTDRRTDERTDRGDCINSRVKAVGRQWKTGCIFQDFTSLLAQYELSLISPE